MTFQQTPYTPNTELVLKDVATGKHLPWVILWLEIRREIRYPIRGYSGISPADLDPSRVTLTVEGYVRPNNDLYFRTLLLEPHNIACVIETTKPQADGSTLISLREYRYQKPILTLRKTRNRIRYKYIGDGRFAVHDNRGPVLGYVARTDRGYEIEGRAYAADTMKGALKHFREVDRDAAMQRIVEQMKRDGVVSGLIEHLTRKR